MWVLGVTETKRRWIHAARLVPGKIPADGISRRKFIWPPNDCACLMLLTNGAWQEAGMGVVCCRVCSEVLRSCRRTHSHTGRSRVENNGGDWKLQITCRTAIREIIVRTRP